MSVRQAPFPCASAASFRRQPDVSASVSLLQLGSPGCLARAPKLALRLPTWGYFLWSPSFSLSPFPSTTVHYSLFPFLWSPTYYEA